MATLDLTKYGITGTTEIVHNPSYEQLFEEETKAGLEGFEVGYVSELGAVDVFTGVYTGRSPKDKFIVMDDTSRDTVWWNTPEYPNDNKPATQETWNVLKDLAKKELSNKRLFVVDGYCGANPATRLRVRFIMEVAWQAHFVTNMFIRPTKEELETFEPDFTVIVLFLDQVAQRVVAVTGAFVLGKAVTADSASVGKVVGGVVAVVLVRTLANSA